MNRKWEKGQPDTDELVFAEEKAKPGKDLLFEKPWRIIIADDEKEIHTVTRMVFDGISFKDRPIEFISTYSGEETKTVLKQNQDIALVLLDVVMEKEHSGLEVVEYIRNVLNNRFIRIILRTGQPGKAPERTVITEYDINDYKEKTEITAQKLFTTVIAALRSYDDLKLIEHNQKGLEQIIDYSTNLFELQTLKQFSENILNEFISLQEFEELDEIHDLSGFVTVKRKGYHTILAALGDFTSYINKDLREISGSSIVNRINIAITEKRGQFFENAYVGYFCTKDGTETLLYIQGKIHKNEWNQNLLEVFSTHVNVAIDNFYLNREIIDTQKEVIYTLGEVVESRSKETANHVRRVSEFSRLLALKIGLSEEECEIIRMASPMHDVGKIGIPDAILNKPGNLSPEEFELIKTHTTIGYEILKSSKRRIMKSAATIALQHHERWDGSGYPSGLEGKNIHLFGRITAIADVLDALSHKRVYKAAWPVTKVLEYLNETKGTFFDPYLIDTLFDNIDDFKYILKQFPDSEKF